MRNESQTKTCSIDIPQDKQGSRPSENLPKVEKSVIGRNVYRNKLQARKNRANANDGPADSEIRSTTFYLKKKRKMSSWGVQTHYNCII